ncbi:hypothetical protein DRN74_01640 [Candidatus Micrarchaeota archaeon]|nr:MAG: hypothetical protein DRN74_01640 [Candidatus Micrarchaeota archaeon]
MKALEKYQEIAHFAGISQPWLLLGGSISIGAILFFLLLSYDPILSVLVLLISLDVSFGLPFLLASRKVEKIEDSLPDVLQHISTTLKAGSTIEMALKEVSLVDYGPISQEMKRMLDEINKGKTFEEAFNDFAESSHSKLVKKIAIIISAARRSGGALLQTLSLTAEDIRAVNRLRRERKSKTLMQFLFLIAASSIVAPFIFGIVRAVLSTLLSISPFTNTDTLQAFDFTFKLFLVLQGTLTTIGAVMVKEGKLEKSALYIPFSLFSIYVIYSLVSVLFMSLIGV